MDFKETTCFPVEIVEPKTRTFCGNTTVLDKVEFYLDWAQRKDIKSVYVKTTRGRIAKMRECGIRGCRLGRSLPYTGVAEEGTHNQAVLRHRTLAMKLCTAHRLAASKLHSVQQC